MTRRQLRAEVVAVQVRLAELLIESGKIRRDLLTIRERYAERERFTPEEKELDSEWAGSSPGDIDRWFISSIAAALKDLSGT